MNLSEHFSLEELIASREGAVQQINNYPPPGCIDNLKRLCVKLEQVREAIARPIHVNSGFRCPTLNALVHGAKNSAHMTGCAADCIAPQFGDPIHLARFIASTGWLLEGIDQLIYEYNSWVHIAIPETGKPARQQLLTIGAHTQGRYVPGIFGVA